MFITYGCPEWDIINDLFNDNGIELQSSDSIVMGKRDINFFTVEVYIYVIHKSRSFTPYYFIINRVMNNHKFNNTMKNSVLQTGWFK